MALARVLGQHMHWGWWRHPGAGDGTLDDFAAALERMSQRVIDMAGIREGGCVLDAGCGFGGTLASLDLRFSRLVLVGLNIDGQQLRWAREQVRPRPGNRLEFVEGDACAMPFASGSFDAVLALECIFHFPDRRRFFQEARRVLRAGGILVLTDFVPTLLFLPMLAMQDVLFPSYIQRFFGASDLTYPLNHYRSLARFMGFEPLVEEDMTLNTLPTYPVARRLARELGPEAPFALASMLATEFVTRMGLLRYMALSYRKR
ncbi:class I SAM-dependent methyltransferase [Archangium sp. Cb G35]|uniref:class I SAM-dependent methyltransferase n=1 Tax=Archangium sp. Cb G35 TaxID=1920190 RepID=UPI001E61E381|nr:class I SAM-dependent methyltransferase [Archangium sp. Cb G35]